MNTRRGMAIAVRILVLLVTGSLFLASCPMPFRSALMDEVIDRVDEYNEQAQPHPEMGVKRGGVLIPCGTGSSSDFSAVVGLASAPVTFTIENVGTGPLMLTGEPEKVVFSGRDYGCFALDSSPASPVGPSGTVEFTIVFTPVREGLHGATVAIDNDDADENPYTFSVSGTGTIVPEPEIALSEGGSTLPNGGSRHFGEVLAQRSASKTFEIQNSGTADLLLTGTPKAVEVSGPDQAIFIVDPQPAHTLIAKNGGTTSFTVRFAPASPGQKSAQLSIPNSDSNESPFVVDLFGTGVSPEINVYQGNPSNSIASGTGSYAFSDVMVSQSGSPVVFTIENQGSSELHLAGSPQRVSVSGTDSAMFSVTAQPASSTIPSGGTTTFAVSFGPTSTGAKSATMSIASDDANENPYTFTVSGTGTEWHGTKWITGGWDGSDGGAYPSLVVNGASAYVGSVSHSYVSQTRTHYYWVVLSKSADGGATWTNTVVDSYSSTGMSGFSYTSLGRPGSTLRIVYYDERTDDLVLATSTDDGATWSKVTVDSNGDVGSHASIDPSAARISYYDASIGTLKYVKVTDLTPTYLPFTGWNVGQHSSIARDSMFSFIWIGHYDATNGDLRVAKSTDDGSTWISQAVDSGDVIPGTSPPVREDVGQYSRIRLASGINMSYYDATNARLKFARSTDGGSTWTTNAVEGGTTGAADVGAYCSLSLSGASVYISYWDDTNNDIKLIKGTDYGATWGTPRILTYSGDRYSSVHADGDKVYVCYRVRDSAMGLSLLYLAKSLDGGATF